MRLALLLGLAIAKVMTLSQIPLHQQQEAPLLGDDFVEFARNLVDEWDVPGLAIGVLRDSDTGLQTQFINIGQAGDSPVTEDTLFAIASNSKAFTAAAVDQFVRRGQISWTDKASKVIPDLSFSDDAAQNMLTLQDILAHLSGVPRHELSYRVGDSLSDVVGRIKHLKPSAEIRSEWQYNNQMYIAAAHLVARLSGQPFTDYVKDHFFKPLEMYSTTYTPILDGGDRAKRLSRSFVSLSTDDGHENVEIPFVFNLSFKDVQLDAGAGGIISSTRDLLKWVHLLIRQHRAAEDESSSTRPDLDKILHPDGIKQLTAGRSFSSRSSPYAEESIGAYGHGFWTQSYQGEEFVKHGGDVPGFRSQIVWSSNRQVGIVVLMNANDRVAPVPDIVAYRAFEDLLGLKRIDWNARKKDEQRKAKERLAKLQPPTPSGKPQIPLSHYWGTYSNSGYGAIYVCPPRSTADAHVTELPPACKTLYERYPADAREISRPKIGSDVLWIVRSGFFGETHAVISFTSAGQSTYAASDNFSKGGDGGKRWTESWDGYWATIDEPYMDRRETIVRYDPRPIHLEFEVSSAKKDSPTIDKMSLWGVWGPGPEQEEREFAMRQEGRYGPAEVEFLKVEER